MRTGPSGAGRLGPRDFILANQLPPTAAEPVPVARPDCHMVERRIEGVAGMTIRYECQDCGEAMKIKDKLAGKKGHCPKCKTEFTIPGSSAEEEFLSLDGDDEFVPDIPRTPYVEKSTPMPAGTSRTTAATPKHSSQRLTPPETF